MVLRVNGLGAIAGLLINGSFSTGWRLQITGGGNNLCSAIYRDEFFEKWKGCPVPHSIARSRPTAWPASIANT